MESVLETMQVNRKSGIKPLRYFYVIMGVFSLLFVIAGFSGTYVIPMINGTYDKLPIFHFHGAIFLAWIILCIVQPLLVQRHAVAVHKKVGIFGFILAGMVFVMGITVGIVAEKLRHDPVFFLVTMSDMLLFGSFVGLALLNLKNSQTHRRFIILSLLAILPAAFGRMFTAIGIRELTTLNLTLVFLLQESILIIAILHDAITRRMLHPVYLWGGSALILVHFFRDTIGSSQLWISFVNLLNI